MLKIRKNDTVKVISGNNKNKTGKVATDTGTKFEYMYAELPMIAKTIAPFLHKRGFSYSWNTPRMEAGNLTVECKLRHANGHSETSTCTLPVATRAGMSEQQKVASARKFGERLTLIQVLGITTADPDMDGAEIGAADPTPITELQAHDLEAKAEELKGVKSDFLKFLGVFALIVGITAGTYSSIFIASPLLVWWTTREARK